MIGVFKGTSCIDVSDVVTSFSDTTALSFGPSIVVGVSEVPLEIILSVGTHDIDDCLISALCNFSVVNSS